MEPLKSNEKRGKAAMILIGIITAICTVLVIASGIDIYSLIQHSQGLEMSEFAISVSDSMLLIGWYSFFTAYIISAITFILWFQRAYYNLAILTGNTEYDNGWAIGSWFIPIANLFIPYKIMKELYEKTDQYLLISEDEDYTENRLTIKYIGWWWALWIISNVSFRIIDNGMSMVQALDAIIICRMLYIISILLFIILGFITIIVIQDYAETEKRLYIIKQNPENNLPKEESIPE